MAWCRCHEHPLLATIFTRYGGFQNLRGFVAKHLPIHGRVKKIGAVCVLEGQIKTGEAEIAVALVSGVHRNRERLGMQASGNGGLPAEQHLLLWSVGRLKPSEAVLIDAPYHCSPTITTASSTLQRSRTNSVAAPLARCSAERQDATFR